MKMYKFFMRLRLPHLVRDHPAWRSLKDILPWSILVLAFIACFYPTFHWLNYKYLGHDSYYSHGYIIPFVSAYLVYRKREELRLLPVTSSPSGLVIIIIALMIHILGILGDINFVSGFAMVLYCIGASLYLFGNAITRAIAFPLFFLFFMCPLPGSLVDPVALPMKSMATALGLKIIGLIHIPFIREGFRVHLSDASYLVGTPCNGMRSMISFFALGLLLIYMIRTSTWKKIAILATIPPLAIILNGVRISILLLIANKYGQKAASPQSYLHDASGFFVFIIGFLVLAYMVRKMDEAKTG